MGFKAFKEHFGIDNHIVSIQDGVLYIGSEFISKIIGFDMQTGKVLSDETFCSFLSKYYPQILDCSDEERVALIQTQDQFKQSIPVYTSSNGQIIEKKCEALGFPNVTHDGELMYENSHFANKIDAVKHEQVDLQHRINNQQESIEDLEAKLVAKKRKLAETTKLLDELNSTYSLIS